MWKSQSSTRTIRIARHGALCRISIPLAVICMVLVAASAASSIASAQATMSGLPAPAVQRLSVHLDKPLVPSFMGFGVQLDPYEYPPTPQQWQRIERRLDLLQPAFLRVMFSAEAYCRRLGTTGCALYVWKDADRGSTEPFQQLLRILDYAQAHHIPVMLGEWAWPRLPHDDSVTSIAGPDDARWAEIIAPLLTYLVQERHYTVLRFYNYMNEPNGGWMWPGGKKNVNYIAWRDGLVTMRQVLDHHGLERIALVGPDNSGDWEWLDRTAHDVASTVGAWEMHWYPTDEEVRGGEVFSLLDEKRRMLLQVDPGTSEKPRFLGEAGLITGRVNGDQQPRVRTYIYGVLMADFAAQIAQAGWMGASAWDLDDAMHSVKGHPRVPNGLTLKTWGFWNTEGSVEGHPEDEAIRPWFTPWRLLTQLFPPGAQLFEVSNPAAGYGIRAISGKSEANKHTTWSIMLVNDRDHPITAELDLPGTSQMEWWRYEYTESNYAHDKRNHAAWMSLRKETTTENILLPPRSVVFFTDCESKVQSLQ